MQKYLRIVISIGILISISLAIALPIYYLVIEQPEKTDPSEFLYPNAIWNESIISDMFIENDDIIHFCFSNTITDFGDDVDVIYANLNLKECSITYIPWFDSIMLITFLQLKISLDSQNNPFIYLYLRVGYGSLDIGDMIEYILILS